MAPSTRKTQPCEGHYKTIPEMESGRPVIIHRDSAHFYENVFAIIGHLNRSIPVHANMESNVREELYEGIRTIQDIVLLKQQAEMDDPLGLTTHATAVTDNTALESVIKDLVQETRQLKQEVYSLKNDVHYLEEKSCVAGGGAITLPQEISKMIRETHGTSAKTLTVVVENGRQVVNMAQSTREAKTYAEKAAKNITEIRTSGPTVTAARDVIQLRSKIDDARHLHPPDNTYPIVFWLKDESMRCIDAWDKFQASNIHKDTNYAPKDHRFLSRGKVRIVYDKEEYARNAIEKIKRLPGFDAETAKKRMPAMILKGVHKDTGKTELVSTIIKQNERIAALVNRRPLDECIRWCVEKPNRSKSGKLYNAIVEVDPGIRKEMLRTGRVNVHNLQVHVEDSSPLMQCYNCLQFGHTSKKCGDFPGQPKRTVAARCSHCATEGHTFRNCPNMTARPKCYNCAGDTNKKRSDHSATSCRCPKVIEATMRAMEDIDYGE